MAFLTYESSLRELPTRQGVLRYHEAGSGLPLLLLHGSGPGVSGWRNFRGNLPVFAEHFRSLVLEFPGFGVSDPTDEPPIQAAATSVIRMLDGLEIDRADIVGNSLGGMIAAQVAVDFPDRVRRLVTIGGVGRSIFTPLPAEGINLLVEFAEDPTREKLVQWLRSMVFNQEMITEALIDERWQQATDPKTFEYARGMYGREALGRTVAAVESGDAPLWTQLHKIKAPTLMTWGRDDRVTTLDSALVPLRTIPNVELHVFPNCGHWAMIEAKQAWESVVLGFLTR